MIRKIKITMYKNKNLNNFKNWHAVRTQNTDGYTEEKDREREGKR